jgi:hypothetical protein
MAVWLQLLYLQCFCVKDCSGILLSCRAQSRQAKDKAESLTAPLSSGTDKASIAGTPKI